MSINQVSISGNLGRDAEMRRTQSGMSILNFSVAVNERRKDAQGEYKDYTNWVGCVLFGKRAESLENRLSKGAKVAVQGKLRYSEWETDAGKRSKLEVLVDEIELMSQKKQQDAAYVEAELYDSDCPF